ncbi:MAG: 3-ketoacyl-ACP reductase [Betaproteobacteria bacterium]
MAVVTGGRRGIGQACAYALADAGFDIVIVDLADDAAATLGEVRARGAGAHMVVGDIADIDRRAELVDRIFGAFGTVDCLVNNAGVLSATRGQDLLDVTAADFDNVMAVNLRGTFFLTQEIARRMVAEGDAKRPLERSIITISSGAVGRARTDSPEYAFSKTCLALMSQMFALRLGKHAIRTYEIRPGINKTEMSRSAWEMYEVLVAEGRFPIARLGLPEDVARTVGTLATGMLPYCTGGHIYVDGGFHIPTSERPRRK